MSDTYSDSQSREFFEALGVPLFAPCICGPVVRLHLCTRVQSTQVGEVAWELICQACGFHYESSVNGAYTKSLALMGYLL